MFFVVLVFVLAFTDLVIKYGIDNIPDEEFPRRIPKDGNVFELQKVHNPGFPFGFLRHFPELVKMVPLVVTSGVLGAFSYLLPRKGNTAEKVGFSLILSGALSNLFDRFFRNYVVDYIHIKKEPLDKAVFNLADFFIAAGTAVVAVTAIVREIKNLFNACKGGT